MTELENSSPARPISSDNNSYLTAQAWIASAAVWLLIGTLYSLLQSLQLVLPTLYSSVPFLSYGRLLQIEINGLVYFWLSMGFYGAFFYIVPKLTGRSLVGDRLGMLTMAGWNLVGVAMVITLSLGINQSHRMNEMAWPLDIALLVLMIINAVIITATMQRRVERKLYPSLWYILAGVWLLPILYALGNVIWSPLLDGSQPYSGAFKGINDVAWGNTFAYATFTLWLVMGGFALAYFIVPIVGRSPLYSRSLAIVSFWGLLIFGPMLGQAESMNAPTPNFLKIVTTVGALGLAIPILTFLTNIWMTLRGSFGRIYASLPLKYVMTGTMLMLWGSIAALGQAFQITGKATQLTLWVPSFFYVFLLGSIGLFLMGAIYYIIPVTLKRSIVRSGLVEVQFWLYVSGILLVGMGYQIGGLVQGMGWLDGQTPYKNLPSLRPYFFVNALGMFWLLLGAAIQVYVVLNALLTARRTEPMDALMTTAPAEIAS